VLGDSLALALDPVLMARQAGYELTLGRLTSSGAETTRPSFSARAREARAR
jgi:hypothetical protein